MMVMAGRLLNFMMLDILCLYVLSGALGRGYFSPTCGFPLLEGLPRVFFWGKCGLTSSEYMFKLSCVFRCCVLLCFVLFCIFCCWLLWCYVLLVFV